MSLGILLGACAASAQPRTVGADAIDRAIHELTLDYRSDEVLDLERCRRLLEQVEALDGAASSRFAQILELTIEARIRDGERRSEELFDMALRLADLRAARKREQPEPYARALHLLGRLEHLGGRFESALEFYDASLTVRRGLDDSSLEVARSLESVGSALDDLDRRAEALGFFEQALGLLESAGARGDAARVFNTLGGTLHRLGEHEEAAAAFTRALELGRKALGTSHPIQARSHHNLGYVAHVLGDFERAESNLRRALEIRLQVHGEVDPVTASTQAALGDLEHDLGKLPRARAHLEAAWEAQRAGLGDEHPRTVATLSRLGALLLDLGLGDEALAAQTEALTVSRRVYPEGDVSTAEILLQLAAVQRSQGDDDAARAHLLGAREIFRRATADRHVGAAQVECDLAQLDEESGDLARASSRFARCDSLFAERDLEHPGRIDALRGLSRTAGDLVSAGTFLAHAERIAVPLAGEAHPLRIEIQVDRAELLAQRGEVEAALSAAVAAARQAREWARLGVATLSHRESLRFESLWRRPLDLVLSLARRHPELAADRAWDEVIQARGLVLDSHIFRARLTRHCGDASRRARLDELDDVTQRLGALWHRGAGPLPETSRARLATTLRRRAETLERELAADPDCPLPSLPSPGLDDVLAGLSSPAGALAGVPGGTRAEPGAGPLLLATARYIDRLGREPVAQARYVAWVAAPGEPPRLIDLGAAAPLDAAVDRWSELAREAVEGRANDRQLEVARRELSSLLWRPLAPFLARPAERLLWVPDHALRMVPLAALCDDAGRDLLDVLPPVARLATERDVVDQGPRRRGRGLLAVGAPVPSSGIDANRGTELLDPEAPRLPELQGAETETRDIARQWQAAAGGRRDGHAVLLLGSAATEDAVRRLAPGSEVLHVATHVVQAETDDPLLGSALVLTGFGSYERRGRPDDDGFLSAAEIARLDLGSVAWVVLSGCESAGRDSIGTTALGSLQRAFRFAGVDGIVTSLWPVADRWAMEYMQAMYESFLRHGDMPRAVRDAAVRLRATFEQRSGRRHPERWAAFVVDVGGMTVHQRRTR